MKKTLLIILPLLLIVGYAQNLVDETLIDKDGLKYHPDTNELYSGKVFKNRMGGKKEFEGSYKDGKKDGLWTGWHDNGQKKSEATFNDGKLMNSEKCWDKDGIKKECE